jgi:multiple sugar transport system ATP-binding protein
MMAGLELRGIGKGFGATRALDDVHLEVKPGEIVGVTGPSGAGKSTLCRIVAGVETPSEGDVFLDDTRVTSLPPERRRAAFMFESYALYPHLTVFENVAFPLRAPGAPRIPDIHAVVREVLRFVELENLEARLPGELSGGQKQRVALCRALVQTPRAWLLDEPISHLDAKLQHILRGAIRRRLVTTDTPTIWTSPDAGEALAVADRVAVLVGGRVLQMASPAEIYRRPATVEVARLIGDPPMNLLGGTLIEDAGALRFQHAGFSTRLPRRLVPSGASRQAVLGLRPSDIQVVDHGGVRGEVWVWEPLGKYGILTARLGPDLVKVKVAKTRSWAPGETVALSLGAAEPVLFDAATGAAFAVDPSSRRTA